MSDEYPKTCRCGFVAENEDEALAHAAVEHPEAFDDGGGSR